METKINSKSGFKKTKIGWIPNDWELSKLEALVNIESGHSPSKYNLVNKGKYPYIKVEDMNNCYKYQFASRFYSNDVKKLIPKGSVIFPKRGAAILNNKVRIATTSMYMDSNMMSIAIKNNLLNEEFLFYTIVNEKLGRIADTSTIPQINNKHIYPYKIPLPPLKEQQKIAKILSTWDEAIEATQSLITQLQKRKKGLMQELLSGKKRLDGFSDKWETIRGNQLFENISNKKHNGEFEVLSATQEKGVIPRSEIGIDIKYDKKSLTNYKKIEIGDFIISLRSFQGGIEYSNYQGLVSAAYTVLRENLPISKKFYREYMKTENFINRLNSIIYGIRDGKQISYKEFGTLKFFYPPLIEQEAISKILIVTDEEIGEKKLYLDKLKEQKKGLMQQLLTGQKRVKL